MIGQGAVVAAARVVASDVPPYAVVAGNPARVVRRRFDDADLERFLAHRVVGVVTGQHHRARSQDHAGTPAELERIAHEIGALAR